MRATIEELMGKVRASEVLLAKKEEEVYKFRQDNLLMFNDLKS